VPEKGDEKGMLGQLVSTLEEEEARSLALVAGFGEIGVSSSSKKKKRRK